MSADKLFEGGISVPALFDPAQTLDCGQAFRWREIKGERPYWEGLAGGKLLRLYREGETLRLSCPAEEFDSFWRRYFDFDEDYAAKRALLSAMSPAIKEAAEFAPGIVILRQEPWEALCSFIISQNNNIPRIKGIIDKLCAMFGEEKSPGLHSFPGPEKLASLAEENLAPLHSGYRARYLIDCARRVVDGRTDLDAISRGDTEYGRQELRKIVGVGPKVAECALLYGFHKTDCFPMDVWMKRAMAVLLPDRTPADFGENAGLAQQYIFHYSRLHPELFKTE